MTVATETYRLSETQRRFVLDQHRYALFLGGIGAGKSHAGAVKALVQEFSRPPSLGMVVAPTYPMLRDASWRTALELWAPILKRVVRNEMRMELATGHEVVFRSADEPDHLRGVNASWAWLDEAAMCHPDTWPIVIGRLRQGGEAGRAWVTTTPKGMNWLYQVFVVQATDEMSVERASTRSNPFLDPAFVHSLVSQYSGEFAQQELDAEWIADDAASLYPYAWLEAAAEPAAYDGGLGRVTAGLDIAGPGEDETALTFRQGGAILEQHAWMTSDPYPDVVRELRRWAHAGLVVQADSAGIGWHFVTRLRSDGFTVVPVNVGATSEELSEQGDRRFANLKAELYWQVRERLQSGELTGLTDPLTRQQLASVHYTHRRGMVEIESKDQAARRGVKSPDRAESVILAFARLPHTLQLQTYTVRSGGR